jgi:hypothetical protein
MTRVGVISDTHGLLRPEAMAALAGVEYIVHAGDIGAQAVLDQLRQIAPVTAVRGNNDKESWAEGLPDTNVLNVLDRTLYVLHDISELEVDPSAAGYAVVVTGHSHKPAVVTKNGVLFVNPGSAGPRRFSLPVTIAILDIGHDDIRAEIRELNVAARNR